MVAKQKMIKSILIKLPCCSKAAISPSHIPIRPNGGPPGTCCDGACISHAAAAELVAHIQNTNTQYNLPAFRKKLSRKYNHDGVAERFEDPEVRKSVEVDLAMIESFNQILKKLEWHIEKTARQHDYHTLYLLRSIPGVGQILALVILYEIHDIKRFPGSRTFLPMPA